MSAPRSPRIAWGLAALTAIVMLVGLVLVVIALNRPERPGDAGAVILLAGIVLPWAAIGLLVATRRPDNVIGWLFLVTAFGLAFNTLAVVYTGLAQTFEPRLPGAAWSGWLDTWLWSVFGIVLPVVVFLVFPNGRFLSPFWRYGTIAILVAAAVTIGADALAPGPTSDFVNGPENPVGIDSPVRPGVSWFGSYLLGPLVMVFVITALVLRFRRSDGEGRAQIKWVLLTAALACAGFLGAFLSGLTALFVFGLAALAATPVAAGLAILKYRLYEIDGVVNRTVVYGAASALLAGLYFGIVLGLQEIFSGLTRGNDLAIAGSTLAVAALFRPVRARIQAFVDRRFYRRRYDAEQALTAFSNLLRDEVDLDDLATDLGAAVRETMQPRHVSLWLRTPDLEPRR